MDVVSYLLGKKSSGGGSAGLEYEEGTFTPTENVYRPFIEYANSHNKMPLFVAISYYGNSAPKGSVLSVNYWSYIDTKNDTGKPSLFNADLPVYAQTIYGYIQSGNAGSMSIKSIFHSQDELTDDNNGYPRYYVNENGFYPGVQGNNGARFLANETYKWIAIWK